MTIPNLCYNPTSLKNISSKILKKCLSCNNVLDIAIFSHILKLGNLCEEAKEFMWTNKSNEVLKKHWKKLEIANPKFFEKAVEIMMEVFECSRAPRCNIGPQIMNSVFFVMGDINIEDICVVLMEDGLMMDNALKILLSANKVNARKVVQKTSEFIWNSRKCWVMQNQWKHLQKEYPELFLYTGKIMLQL